MYHREEWIPNFDLTGAPSPKVYTYSDMKKLLTYSFATIAILCLGAAHIYAQDIFDGLFEKEQPRFFGELKPTAVPGEVQLVFHYTHSKASEVEASVWIADLGASLQDTEQKQMVSGLRALGNRQRDTILLTGLTPRHFYNIGVDYRVKSVIPKKFESTVVREHFRYERPKNSQPVAQEPPAPNPAERDWQARSAAPQPAPAPQQPCKEPQLGLRIDPAGYCDRLNRPAVIISCSNCQGTTWDFLVEVKSADGQWFPTRADGRPQAALGVAPRTEPLCMIAPGQYELRVLAWGENCAMPTIKQLGTRMQVGSPAPPQSYSSGTTPYRTQPLEPVSVPEVCGVSGTAMLIGKTIRGGLMLPANSECTALNPHAEVAYIHPGYRDINMGKINLYPGVEMPFELDLDDRDLQRGIHTLQVTVYMPLPDSPRPIAAETFWIRAEETPATAAGRNPVIPGLEDRLQDQPVSYDSSAGYAGEPTMRGTIGTKGIERTEDDLYIDEALMEEQGNTISVTATDPNCTPIQDLQLVYSPTQPDRPLYLSWLSPRCCQEEGCKYTVWAGPAPEKLSLVVNGQKAGAQVSEILNNLPAQHNYFEVAVETSNGVRKAAYVPGSGPIYGIEAVLDYHDQFKPQKSDPLRGRRTVSGSETQQKGLSADLADRTGAPARPASMENNPLQPQLPISKFRPCKYERATTVQADYPIQSGEKVTIDYAFTEPGHQFTLYHQPFGSSAWQIAPGTTELQPEPAFELQATDYHAGKYLVLVYKPSKNWGCLSAPLSEPIELNIVR